MDDAGALSAQCTPLAPLLGFFVGLVPVKYNDPTGHASCNIPIFGYAICHLWNNFIEVDELPGGSSQSPEDDWVDLGFDWLFEYGPEERVFSDGDYMVENLRDHPGVVAAMQEYLQNPPPEGEKIVYGHDFGLSGYIRAWWEADGTGHFLGSYNVEILNDGNDTVTITVSNRSGRESFTNVRVGRGTVSDQITNLKNLDFQNVRFPRHILSNKERDETYWGGGGNFDQRYEFQESTIGRISPE